MEDLTIIIKNNFAKLENDILEIKRDFPNIDSIPDSHDGSYELVRRIVRQYQKEIKNSQKWGAKDVDALYYATTFCDNDTKIKYINNTNLKNKIDLKQTAQSLNKNFKNNKYTNNIDEAKDIGMFKNVSGGFGPETNTKATEEDLKKFIIYCTEILDENNYVKIYNKFERDLCDKVSDNNMSIGILSQILHCLKPKIFPILNGAGLEYYKKALNIKLYSETRKEIQIDGSLKNYIKTIKAIKEYTKDFEFSNFRIPDIVAQKYYFNFNDIKKYFKNLATTPSKNRSDLEKKQCQRGHKNFTLISEKINKQYNFECNIHKWNNGKTANKYFWTEYKSEQFKKLPYSISLFAEYENLQLRICIECKGENNTIFDNWKPDINNEFDALGNKTSKLMKIFYGPFEYANSRNIIEQIQIEINKLIPSYNELCNIALGHKKLIKEKKEDNTMQEFPLNQILYGPPGIGKTYNTVIEAMKIIGSEEVNMKDEKGVFKTNYTEDEYKILKKEFDDYKKAGQIEFVTFHQSYSYEEFVEGIKPDIDPDTWNEPTDKLTYKGANGIFKNISNRALFDRLDIDSKLQNTILDFKQLIYKFVEEHPIGSKLFTSTKNAEFTISKYTKNSARITPTNGDYTYSITFRYLEYAYNKNMKTQNEISKIEGVASGLSCYYYAIYQELLKIKEDNKPQENIKYDINNIDDENKFQLVKEYYENKISLKDNVNSNVYILIIDEINRGNISKIFGELITLIEDDKRENLTVTLPYSKEPFTIPKNLYIIGTMNTSDRSIASIDIALRRRFKFIEMMPDSKNIPNEKIGEFNLREIFEKLNKRISILLDRDHQIGHSYFMNWKKYDINTLQRVWFESIMPLLNEYFYCDWEKLQAILGEAKEKQDDKYPSFLKMVENVNFAIKYDCDNDDKFDFVKETEIDFQSALKNAFIDKIQEQQEGD